MATRYESPPSRPADPTPCAVQVKRGDLEVSVSGSAAFVTPTLEHVLTVLGVIQAPPAA